MLLAPNLSRNLRMLNTKASPNRYFCEKRVINSNYSGN